MELLSKHCVVLAHLRADPTMRLKDVAAAMGLSMRQVTYIVGDLLRDGWLVRTRADDDGSRFVHTIAVGPTVNDRVVTVPDLDALLWLALPKA